MADGQNTPGELFRAGRLAAAVDAANADVRRAPGDFAKRHLLAELLVFTQNIERADVVLDAAAKADPKSAVAVAEFRQLLRADTARLQCLADGRVPEFLGEPTAAIRAALEARIALRAGDLGEAERHAAAIETARPRVSGIMQAPAGELSFDDFRDADDLFAGFFEVLTVTGKYFWIPTERVAQLEFHPPRRPRDLAWRRAAISVIDGPDGEVYLPALYPMTETDASDDVRLGRTTEWIEKDGEPVRGVGQRMFLVGEDAFGITEISMLRFHHE